MLPSSAAKRLVVRAPDRPKVIVNTGNSCRLLTRPTTHSIMVYSSSHPDCVLIQEGSVSIISVRTHSTRIYSSYVQ